MSRATDRLNEARITDLKESHEARIRELNKVIDVLAEQVEYLRATGGLPQPLRRGVDFSSLQPMSPAPAFSTPQHMTEEEEDVRGLHDNGLLDADQLKSALAELGIEA